MPERSGSLGMWSRQYIERVMGEEPSWMSISTLEQMLQDPELGPTMGGIALLLRSGPETALEDLPAGFWSAARPYIARWDAADKLVQVQDWDQLDALLDDEEPGIILALHAEYCRRIREQL